MKKKERGEHGLKLFGLGRQKGKHSDKVEDVNLATSLTNVINSLSLLHEHKEKLNSSVNEYTNLIQTWGEKRFEARRYLESGVLSPKTASRVEELKQIADDQLEHYEILLNQAMTALESIDNNVTELTESKKNLEWMKWKSEQTPYYPSLTKETPIIFDEIQNVLHESRRTSAYAQGLITLREEV